MKKIRVGIISHYFKNNNYGGMLQAYALCEVLNGMGFETKQISYNMRDNSFAYRSLLYKTLRKGYRAVKSTLKFLRHIPIEFKLLKRKKKLRQFRESIPHTKTVFDLKTIRTCNDFDVYITGSDQVWNPSWYDDAFLLKFVTAEKVKMSYAASVGKKMLNEAESERFRDALKDFSAISVREGNAVDLLQGLTEKTVELVLDPTLLLNKQEWARKCEGECPTDKYIFCYFLSDNDKQRKLAFDFAKKKGYRLVSAPCLNGHFRKADSKTEGTNIYDMPPGRFLNLIRNAECIFTDSFHATVFSHIFQRDFFVFINAGASREMSDRLYTLTDMFETQDRVCESAEQFDIQYLLSVSHVDYNKEFNKYDDLKMKSIGFLKDNIKRVNR